MDELQASAESQRSAPREVRQIMRPRTDHHGTADRPFRELTIRDLIVELGKVEDALAHRLDADCPSYSERHMTQREKLIIAELHSRRSQEPAPAPWQAGDHIAEVSS